MHSRYRWGVLLVMLLPACGLPDLDGDKYSPDGQPPDCNDRDPDIHPEATELCNGIDDDCDGMPDSDEHDTDQDDILGCDNDCDDLDAAIFPGALEVCDNADNDCDALVDEDDPNLTESEWYLDHDDDGFGDSFWILQLQTCDVPEGYVSDDSDCDDTNAAISPGASERCNGIDDDCDDQIDEGLEECLEVTPTPPGITPSPSPMTITPSPSPVPLTPSPSPVTPTPTSPPVTATPFPTPTPACDGDGDGFCEPEDCDDVNPAVHPGAIESCIPDGSASIDFNCDGRVPTCWRQAEWSSWSWLSTAIQDISR